MAGGFHRTRVSGYLLSMGGTTMLAVPTIANSRGNPWLLAIAFVGIGLSLGGIGLRWQSHREERQGKPRG